jgi:hypothetical protein
MITACHACHDTIDTTTAPAYIAADGREYCAEECAEERLESEALADAFAEESDAIDGALDSVFGCDPEDGGPFGRPIVWTVG